PSSSSCSSSAESSGFTLPQPAACHSAGMRKELLLIPAAALFGLAGGYGWSALHAPAPKAPPRPPPFTIRAATKSAPRERRRSISASPATARRWMATATAWPANRSAAADLGRLALLAAGLGEQLGFGLAPHPFGDVAGVVDFPGVAAGVAQAQRGERVVARRRRPRFDLGRLVVALGQIEAQRPPAARAIVAVAATQHPHPLGRALALELPGS